MLLLLFAWNKYYKQTNTNWWKWMNGITVIADSLWLGLNIIIENYRNFFYVVLVFVFRFECMSRTNIEPPLEAIDYSIKDVFSMLVLVFSEFLQTNIPCQLILCSFYKTFPIKSVVFFVFLVLCIERSLNSPISPTFNEIIDDTQR